MIRELPNNLDIFCHEESISILLSEIMENAIKFNKDGKVRVYEQNNTSSVDIIIEDNGVGMNPDDFNNSVLFSQEDNSQSRQFDGLGMGLAIIKSIAFASNIRVKYETEKGLGTKAYISLDKFKYQ